MARYRTKPCEIEAAPVTPAILQMGGESLLPVWARPYAEVRMSGPFGVCVELYVQTLHGWVKASVGDMIIHGTKGEVYPCDPDVFAKKYEPVEGCSGRGSPASPEFLEELRERARRVGWLLDYSEIASFVRRLYHEANLPVPELEPYETE